MDWLLHAMSDGDASKAVILGEKWTLPQALRWNAMGHYHGRVTELEQEWQRKEAEKKR